MERLCALHHRQHTVFNDPPLLGLPREYSFCLSTTTVALPASASSSASLRIGDLGAMLRMCPSFGRSWLRDGRRMKRVMGNVAAISLGRPPDCRRRLSRRRRWSLDRCLLNYPERTRFRVGRVDGVMVTFLSEAKRRMIDQWDSHDLMFSGTYHRKRTSRRSHPSLLSSFQA